MKRISSTQAIVTDDMVFLMPISIVRGLPLAVIRKNQLVHLQLGYYYAMLSDFHLTSEFDCLLVKKKAENI